MPEAGVTVREIAAWLGECLSDDSLPGLQIGAASHNVRTVVFAHALDRDVMEAAAAHPIPLIAVTNPLPITGRSALRWDDPVGALAVLAAQRRVPLLVLPDSIRSGPQGLDESLALAIGLIDTTPLGPSAAANILKFVTFVPPDSLARVQQAAADAGAGRIGNYSHCAFRTVGEGTFLPRQGARPAIGEVGKIEGVEEVRLEMVVPESLADRVVQAVIAAHPYEEVAFDLYPLANRDARIGRGRIGRLPKPVSFDLLLEQMDAALPVPRHRPIRCSRSLSTQVVTVAVASAADAGGRLFREAQSRQADLFITGQASQIDQAIAADTATVLVDLGAAPAVAPGLRAIAERLPPQFTEAGVTCVVVPI
jgi:hypothetical protein